MDFSFSLQTTNMQPTVAKYSPKLGHAIIIAILLHGGAALGLAMLADFAPPRPRHIPGLQVVLTKPKAPRSSLLLHGNDVLDAVSTKGSANFVPKLQTVQTQSQQVSPTHQALPTTDIETQIASLERKLKTYTHRPRRRSISTSTTDSHYAAYLEAWRRKVEFIGNLHYPEQARNQRLYGDLVLQVTLLADGTLKQLRMVHSSGHAILDKAAMNIVKLSAPFAPFPKEIRREVDMLDITRTLRFFDGNQLGWSD